MDSSPVVAITGQVPRAMIGRDAFQETDVIGISLPITKHSVLVDDITELPEKVREAFAYRAGRASGAGADRHSEGRPEPEDGVDRRAPGQEARTARVPHSCRHPAFLPMASLRAVRLLDEAQRPLLMVGHGVILGSAYAEVQALAEKAGIPVDYHPAGDQRASRSPIRCISECRECTVKCTSTGLFSTPT